MILENVFLAEIQLENGDVNEFIDKCWYALNIHKVYPDEKIGNNAFRDWARDLGWITQKTVIVLIKGKVQDSTRRTLETINNYWEKQFYKTDGKPEYEKKVDFIIVS